MANLPFYKFFLKYANMDHLVDFLYKRCMDDIIMRSMYHRDEIYSLCKIAFDEIEDLCINASGPAKTDEGVLITYINNDTPEVVQERDGERYDMMMRPWAEWMNYPVEPCRDTTEFLEAAFVTMTFLGFTSKDCEKRVQEIDKSLAEAEEDLKAGRYMEMEAFDKHIEELLSDIDKEQKKD